MVGLEGIAGFVRFMFDANVLIATLTGDFPLLGERIAACDEGDLVISAVAFAEVALGGWQGKRPPLAVLDQIPGRIEVMPFDHLAAKIYATLPFRRGSFDRLIAAHALSLGLVLITDNERDFADIDDLIVENWLR